MEKQKIKIKSNFHTEVNIFGSKSITNRALILAASSEKSIILNNPLFSDDTIYMIEALRELGNKIEYPEDKSFIKVFSNKERNFGKKEIFVGNAGTVMRFISSYIATGYGEVTVSGNERMNKRPIKELVDSLIDLGVKIEYVNNEGYPPIRIFANGVKKSKVKVSGKNSSQYLSSILMSSPHFENGIEITLDDKIISKPYVEMTLKMMKSFGVEVLKTSYGYKVPKGKYEKLNNYIIEGDMSSASYFLAMALITNSIVKINNFILDSIQGDSKILEILESLGLQVIAHDKTSITVKGKEHYSGFNLNLNDTPDIVPTLSMVALFADTKSSMRDVESLRVKECDRISAICTEIKKLNGDVIEHKDGLEIIPKSIDEYKGAEIKTYDDHRIAMSFSLAGLRIKDTVILNPKCVSKTFPTFFDELSKIYLGGGSNQ